MRYWIFIILGITLCACENRWESEIAMNLPPSLSLIKDGREHIGTDSLKLSLKHKSPYGFVLQLKDEKVYSGTWEIKTGQGALSSSNDVLIDQANWSLPSPDDSLLSLSYLPSSLGTHELTFTAVDPFGASGVTSLTLEVFENLSPIAILETSHQGLINSGHYLLDASASFDQDKAYGGSIAWYRFMVSGRTIGEGTSPSLEYIFQSKGTYTVSLEVHDTDGAINQTSTTIIIE